MASPLDAGPSEPRPLTESQESARHLALRIADIVAETPASDTVVLDIHETSSFSDYFLICSGENERQLRAISEEISEELAEEGLRANRIEGTAVSGWILLDYGDVIVHVFDQDQRAFYRMEQLWASAPRLLSIQ
jgi:ribosome-associated protein